jgi:mono/diheme cytochrome c family protein
MPPAVGDESSSIDAANLTRGAYLAAAGGCVSCHTRPGGLPFVGGRALSTPLGTIYSTNITPDRETGIGRWSADDFRRALHEGVAPDGMRLFPAFPYTSFTLISDADVDAIYAYLLSRKPVRFLPPANGVLFSFRWPLRVWNWMFFKPGRFVVQPSQSEQWNRGAYLVQSLGHCGGCHTPRTPLLAEAANAALSGGGLDDAVGDDRRIRHWSAVNLTGARQGLAAWSMDDLTRYLSAGYGPRAGMFGPMNEVFLNSLKPLAIEDLRAIALYLKSLPALEAPPASTAADAADAANAAKRGEGIYLEYCAKCHRASGRGGPLSGPPLAGSAIVQASDPASLINVILYGAETPAGATLGGWETMRPYATVLDDAAVAALTTYLRSGWENRATVVTAVDVKKQR